MKRRLFALLLASALAVSGGVQSVAALETDFSDTAEVIQEEILTEDGQADSGEEEASAETESGEAISEAEPENEEAEEADLQSDGICEAEDPEGEDPEAEVSDADSVSAEEELFGDGVTDMEVAADDTEAHCEYEVGYISAEQYEYYLTCADDVLETEMISGEGTLTEALNALLKSDGENTGYCLLVCNNAEGYEDLVVPEGLNVFMYGGDDHTPLKSITANGNVTIRDNIYTPGTLEIKEGEGRVGFFYNYIYGKVVGSGSDDNVELYSWVYLDGMTGVENIYLVGRDEYNSIELRSTGPLEFYNLYCDGKSMGTGNDVFSLWLNIKGYSEDHIPVFHKSFDFGSNTFSNEEGDTWEDNYGIGICYFEKFEEEVEGEGWPQTDIGAGEQAIKFEGMADEDILDILVRTGFYYYDKGYPLDLNGYTFDSESVYNVNRFVDCDTMTAQRAFFADWNEDWDYEASTDWVCDMPDVSQALRAVAADQQDGASGYYRLEMPVGAEITETLTVPDGVSGVQYHINNNYDETSDTTTYVPVKISAINVSEGKVLMVEDGQIETDTLTISGAGTADLRGCLINADTVTASGEVSLRQTKVNADMTADEVGVADGAVVKSLTCKTLGSINEYSRFVVSEYLKFDTGHLNATVIYALPGAYLYFGEIDNVSMPEQSDGEMDVYLGVEGDSRAQLYFGGTLTLGTVSGSYTDENGDTQEYTYDKGVYVSECDVAAARAAGASFTDDCFTMDYHYDWDEGDDDYWGSFRTMYAGEEKCIATVSSALDVKEVLRNVFYITKLQISGEETERSLNPRAVYYTWEEFKGLDEGIDGNKYLTFYGVWDEETGETELVKTPAYYLVGEAPARTVSIADAQILAIADQVYAGKALTPAVTVTLNGKTLTKDTDYTVSYANNDKAGAAATVTVTGKGSYSGTVSASFQITAVPAKNKVFTVGSLKYKVTKSAYKNGTVSVSAPAKKSITSAAIPSTVKIDGYTFKVTAVASKAFKGCTKLKSVTIGSNVTSIGSQAFSGCTKLAKVIIGKKVTTIGKQAFNGCKALKSITIKSTVLKKVGASALKGISSKATIKVPSSKLKAYRKLLKNKGQKSSVTIKK